MLLVTLLYEDKGKVESGSDVIELLEIIQMICMSRDITNYYPLKAQVQSFRQYNGMSVTDYDKEFTMLVKIAEKCGADYATPQRKEWSSQSLHKVKCTSMTRAEKKEVLTKDSKEQYLATIFILNAN